MKSLWLEGENFDVLPYSFYAQLILCNGVQCTLDIVATFIVAIRI